MVFDEVNLDQEWKSLGVGLDLGCVCVTVIQNHEHEPWTIGMSFKGLLITNHMKLNQRGLNHSENHFIKSS